MQLSQMERIFKQFENDLKHKSVDNLQSLLLRAYRMGVNDALRVIDDFEKEELELAEEFKTNNIEVADLYQSRAELMGAVFNAVSHLVGDVK